MVAPSSLRGIRREMARDAARAKGAKSARQSSLPSNHKSKGKRKPQPAQPKLIHFTAPVFQSLRVLAREFTTFVRVASRAKTGAV